MDTSVNDCFRPVSRYWDRIQRPEQILQALPEAMRVLASPVETGAVTICLPEDVQAEAFDVPEQFFAKKVYDVGRPPADPAAIREVAALIQAARRPLLIAGGGVHYSDACAELAAFAARTGIPVCVTQAGKGALLDDDAQCLGAVGVTGTSAANAIAATADLVIAIGTRLSDFTTASKTLFQNEHVRFVSVQINPFDAHKHGALPLVGDARTILAQLGAALVAYRVSDDHARSIAAARGTWHAARAAIHATDSATGLRQSDVIRIVNEHVGPDATIVHAAGGLPGDLHKLWWSASPNQVHSEYGYSCMGYEIAGALGVKLAQPDRDVYALLGDGSYLMLHTEILTAIQEQLKIVIVLLDNGGYQCIHRLQRACGGASFGNEFRSRNGNGHAGELLAVDFVANARSLGAAAYRAVSESELVSALDAARREPRTTLIHVPVHASSNIPGYAWWDVPMAEASDQPDVAAARQEYERARRKQVFYYS
jgi:3D-(3,5/4)-trihydroxycyclohexane-1,2-dione acylhydrolase (decyclizing)